MCIYIYIERERDTEIDVVCVRSGARVLSPPLLLRLIMGSILDASGHVGAVRYTTTTTTTPTTTTTTTTTTHDNHNNNNNEN